MNKYKTVKEVCALTGLTGKHLYYFHHEKVVQAAAYANYSVEGYDGYKLYDDAAVEKLQQIALYYQLGLKRNEIRSIMLDPHYDSNRILETLLAAEREKRIRIDRHIAALEYLALVGTRNGVTGALRGISLDDLGRTLLSRGAEDDPACPGAQEAASFAREWNALVAAWAEDAPGGENALPGQMLALGERYLGACARPFLLGLCLSAFGEGTAAHSLGTRLTPRQGRMLIAYILKHTEPLPPSPPREARK